MSGHNHPDNHVPEDFEGVYASGVQWSGNPNDALVREASGLPPGTALDIGCGEGADAVWLAENGWAVTAVDPSATAIKRSAALAQERGVSDRALFHVGDATVAQGRTFDLITCSYVPFRRGEEEAIRGIEKLVSPGGTLLWIHHDAQDFEILSPRDVAGILDELEVLEVKKSQRHVTSGAGAHHTDDVVLLARRP